MSQASLDLARLEKARKIVAQAIKLHGDAYLPVFIRLDQEIEALKVKDSALNKALLLAAQGD